MERLTVKWKPKLYDMFDPVDIADNEYSKINFEKLLTKLGEYEDLEEQCIEENQCGLRELLTKWKAFFDDIEALYDYRKAEEQGLLLRLPCKAGTVVYEIRNNTDACYDCPHYSDFFGMDAMCDKVKTENISGPRYADNPLCEKQFLEIIEFKASLDFIFRHRNDFVETVFLTREEAESTLAEKGGA